MRQYTLHNAIRASGVGAISGERISMRLLPAPEGSGIIFRRTDLVRKIEIAATPDNVCCEADRLCLRRDGVEILGLENLLATLYALGVDNAVVELDDGELPFMDGTAAPFVFLLQAAGLRPQRASRPVWRISEPAMLGSRGQWLRCMPGQGLRLAVLPRADQVAPGILHDVSRALFTSEICYARAPLLNGVADHEVAADSRYLVRRELNHQVIRMMAALSLLGHELHGTIVSCASDTAMHLAMVRELKEAIASTKRRTSVAGGAFASKARLLA